MRNQASATSFRRDGPRVVSARERLGGIVGTTTSGTTPVVRGPRRDQRDVAAIRGPKRAAAVAEIGEGVREDSDEGAVSTVPTELLPKLLRLSDMREARLLRDGEAGTIERSERAYEHRTYTLAEHARGLLMWSSSLEKGVLPLALDDRDSSGGTTTSPSGSVEWPGEPLRSLLLGAFARLKLPTLCSRFPQVHKACLSSLLDAVIDFEKGALGEGDGDASEAEATVQGGGRDGANTAAPPPGTPSGTATETSGGKVDVNSEKYKRWMAAKARAKPTATTAAPTSPPPTSSPSAAQSQAQVGGADKKMDPKYQKWLAAKQAKQGKVTPTTQAPSIPAPPSPSGAAPRGAAERPAEDVEVEVGDDGADQGSNWWSSILESLKDQFPTLSGEPALDLALRVANTFYVTWEPAVAALTKAASTFSFVDLLLGSKSETFDVHNQKSVWHRKGWHKVDGFRQNLERSKPLRDLVRSLGRGAGWGPLRRSPVQALDMSHGRDGLLRSILEQQETRGLCRSDDLARMLPSEACMLAKGRTQPVAKRLFFAKFVQQSLLSYERDGWHSQPTRVPNPLIREVRPTADRGPILLCIDTSGSMRGVREEVAKALVLECMRAAKEQERGCFVYCFSGPTDVRELELSVDAEGSIDRLLNFLEKVFNGGSDLNEPLKRCMDKLHQAEWSNSDVLIVSDGELRCPAEALMKQLAGAKDKWNLRVHGVVLPASQVIRAKRREETNQAEEEADISVLRTLCTNPTRGGKEDVCVHVFRDWQAFESDVFAEEELVIQASVNRGKLIEEWRQKEIQRLQDQERGKGAKADKKLRAHPGMKYDKADKRKKAQRDRNLKAFPGMNKYE